VNLEVLPAVRVVLLPDPTERPHARCSLICHQVICLGNCEFCQAAYDELKPKDSFEDSAGTLLAPTDGPF
jgi:hypothetical protein